MSPRAPSGDQSLPSTTLLVAPAWCLIDEWLEQAAAAAGPDAEVVKVHGRSFLRDAEGLRREVLDQLEGCSLFAPRRMVIVHDGHALLKNPALKAWIQEPTAGTSLVFTFLKRTPKDKPPALPKGLGVTLVETAGPTTPAQRRHWLEKRAKRHDLRISAEATNLLEELTGTSLDRLAAELEKLALYCLSGSIEPEHVEALIGHSAGRDFDRLLETLKAGRPGPCLALVQAIAEEGLLAFGGGRVYGRRQTAAALLPILLSRIRRSATLGTARGETQDALVKALRMNPWYARRLAQDARDLGPTRLHRWVAAALATETVQKRVGGVAEDELLTLLTMELTAQP